ncbi:MAG: hypothetical protein A4E45_00763 [Methanosaeta sp. PtaB.Bin039]|nr:MAG: hypothetical protein A4E45_00763 [Methanosaeta sp. PtaB.Bin039]OPY47750.1 MAG: hypothetical protein A4E47_00135 [Methanosaeta sp. PtaU1.Bin028]HOT07728.1 hypothetical protein [Methanotrichaceae archaeon]HQF17416.1 hypothetical protein [Methanotrichaceae archaeon]HQI92174.1 hypothetical protein [Methanotrichaceae archaeon]
MGDYIQPGIPPAGTESKGWQAYTPLLAMAAIGLFAVLIGLLLRMY